VIGTESQRALDNETAVLAATQNYFEMVTENAEKQLGQ